MPSEFDVGHKAWSQASRSQILAVADQRDIDPYYVMIPSIEVARFFFCHTSFFARSLFADGWESLIRRPYCDQTDLPDSITVAHHTVFGLSQEQAKHLGLLLTSQRMQEQVRGIYQAQQSHRSDFSAHTPLTCRFPFDEETTIEAEVIRVPTNTEIGHRFFVTRLLQCERPIPFNFCFVNPAFHPGQGDNSDERDELPPTSSGKGDKEPPAPGDKKGGGRRNIGNLDELEESGELDDGQGAPTAGDGIHIAINEDRFPGLRAIGTELTKKERQTTRHEPSSGQRPQKGDHSSTGHPSGNRPIAQADIDANPEIESNDPWVKLLIQSVPHLRKMGCRVAEPMTLFLDEFSKKATRSRSWVRMEDQSVDIRSPSRFRSRLMIALQIEFNGALCIVAEIERREDDSFGLNAFYIDRSTNPEVFLNTLAEKVTEKNGWPRFHPKDETFEITPKIKVPGKRGVHRKVDTAEQMAQKIKSCFLETS